MRHKLKPCPFCGARVDLYFKEEYIDFDKVVIQCNECCIGFSANTQKWINYEHKDITAEAIEKVVNKWNNRA